MNPMMFITMLDEVNRVREENSRLSAGEKSKNTRDGEYPYEIERIAVDVEDRSGGYVTVQIDTTAHGKPAMGESRCVKHIDLAFTRAGWAAFRAYVDQAIETPEV